MLGHLCGGITNLMMGCYICNYSAFPVTQLITGSPLTNVRDFPLGHFGFSISSLIYQQYVSCGFLSMNLRDKPTLSTLFITWHKDFSLTLPIFSQMIPSYPLLMESSASLSEERENPKTHVHTQVPGVPFQQCSQGPIPNADHTG